MNVAMALWGALCAAEIEIWDNHLEELLALFAAEIRSCGGQELDIEELKLHLSLYAATMGLAWLLDAPARRRSKETMAWVISRTMARATRFSR
jgi:hypothetical protein